MKAYISWAPAMMAATVGTAAWRFFQNSVSPLRTTDAYSCVHSYSTEILSLDPLVVYINNFLSPHEIQRLLELRFERSCLPYPRTDGSSDFFNYTYLENPIRTSSYFVVDYDSEDEVAQCVISRAEKLLGHTDVCLFQPSALSLSSKIIR